MKLEFSVVLSLRRSHKATRNSLRRQATSTANENAASKK